MDTVTQMLFGAAVAQAGFRRRLGRKAAVAGAVAGLVPDLDIVVLWVAGPFAYWEHHRGLTHSLLFGPLVGPFAGWLAWRAGRRRAPPGDPAANAPETLRAWIALFVLALVTHPIIDLFTAYGTQLLYPFSDRRFAIDALPIVDPLYSTILLVAVLVGAFAPRRPGLAENTARVALVAVAFYTLVAWDLNERVRDVARASFAEAIGGGAEIDAYPLLFQPVYRRVLAQTPDGAFVGYHSLLAQRPIEWTPYRSDRDEAVDAVRRTREAEIFEWFAAGRVLWISTPGADGSQLVEAYDLRYGMPGIEPSLWGIRARVSPDGRLEGDPETFQRPRPADDDAFRSYFRDALGR